MEGGKGNVGILRTKLKDKGKRGVTRGPIKKQ